MTIDFITIFLTFLFCAAKLETLQKVQKLKKVNAGKNRMKDRNQGSDPGGGRIQISDIKVQNLFLFEFSVRNFVIEVILKMSSSLHPLMSANISGN